MLPVWPDQAGAVGWAKKIHPFEFGAVEVDTLCKYWPRGGGCGGRGWWSPYVDIHGLLPDVARPAPVGGMVRLHLARPLTGIFKTHSFQLQSTLVTVVVQVYMVTRITIKFLINFSRCKSLVGTLLVCTMLGLIVVQFLAKACLIKAQGEGCTESAQKAFPGRDWAESVAGFTEAFRSLHCLFFRWVASNKI